MDPHEAALLARRSVDRARTGTLVTYPRQAVDRAQVTNVAVRSCANGEVVIVLRPGSPAIEHLLKQRFATVKVAPLGCKQVTLHGNVQQLPGHDAAGRLRFQLEAQVVRLGERCETCVDVTEYASAHLDPLVRDLHTVLTHLRRRHHAEQLAACLRARGHDVQFAEPLALQSEGLTVLAGVRRVHLPFPSPITTLHELPPSLLVLLRCRCDGKPTRDVYGTAFPSQDAGGTNDAWPPGEWHEDA